MAKKKKPEPEVEENSLLKKSIKEKLKEQLKEQLEETASETAQQVSGAYAAVLKWFWPVILGAFAIALVVILAPRVYDRFLAPNPEPVRPVTLEPGSTIDRTLGLTDQTGKRVSGSEYATLGWAVFFGFAHCPDICPTTLSRMTSWLSKVARPDRLQMFFISVDPERDTVDALADYMQPFDPRIKALTGPIVLVKQVIENFHVYAKKVQEPGETDYSMDHTAGVILLRSDGAFMGTISMDEPDEVAVGKLNMLTGK